MTRKFKTLDAKADRKHAMGNVVFSALNGFRIGKGECFASGGWEFDVPETGRFNTFAVWSDTAATIKILVDDFTTSLGDTFSTQIEVGKIVLASADTSNMVSLYNDSGNKCEIFVTSASTIYITTSVDVDDLEVFLLQC